MTTLRDIIPTEYLCADDLAGRDHTLTIRTVDVDAKTWEGGKRKRCVAIYFDGAQKGLKLNVTNHNLIAFKLGYGKTLENWVGKRITLYPTVDERIRTDDKGCVRVRPTVPAARAVPNTRNPAPSLATAVVPVAGGPEPEPPAQPEPMAESPMPEMEPAQ